MKVNTVRSKFLGGINAVKDVVKGEDEANPFRYIKVETMGTDSVLLTGSNGDVQITSRVFCEVADEGRIAVAGAYLTRFVGAMDEGPLELDVSSSRASLEGGGAKFTLALGDVESYPVMKGPVEGADGYAKFSVQASTLGQMLGCVSYAACQDRTRSSVCGVNFSAENGWLVLCALDGRRMAMVSHDACLDCERMSATVPNAAVAVLQKIIKKFPEGDVLVQVDETAARFTAPLWSVTTKLVADVYPEFRRAIPTEVAHDVEIDRELFLRCLDQAALGGWGSGLDEVKIILADNEAVFEGRSAVSFAKTRMPVKYDAEKLVIAINPDVIRPVVDCICEKTFRLGVVSQKDPLRISCSAPFTGVVMTLRERGGSHG